MRVRPFSLNQTLESLKKLSEARQPPGAGKGVKTYLSLEEPTQRWSGFLPFWSGHLSKGILVSFMRNIQDVGPEIRRSSVE